MEEQAIQYPPGFDRVNPHSLEDYINARNIQFARVFVNRCGLSITQQEFEELVRQSLALIPVPKMMLGAGSQLQLVFRHDCLSLGCLDPQCSLCENNPNRRCDVNFDRKYLVNDPLKAKCRATIRVEVVDRVTGVLRQDPFLDQVHLEICILDGNGYDAKCLEAGQEREEDLESCFLLVNNKGQSLLQVSSGGVNTDMHKVHIPLQGGKAQLLDLHVTDSSEALLSGRKPPFRLLVRAVSKSGAPLTGDLCIHHAVSEAFVLATRRTRTAGKVEVPNVEDHVSKLEHMGKETVKKLHDLSAAAEVANVELNLAEEGLPRSINKVGEFRKLALMAEADGHLRQKLQQVLKLSKEKWDEGRDHALRAVVVDNYLRVWYSDDSMDVGVLFPCRNGEIDLERPVGLLQKKKDSMAGGDPQYEVILLHQQTPSQRQQVKTLQRAAVANWWRSGHVGWAIFPVDSDQLMSTEVQGQTLNVEQDYTSAQAGAGNSHLFGNDSPFEHNNSQYSQQQQQQQHQQSGGAYASNAASSGGSRLNPAFSPFSAVAQQPFEPDRAVSVTANSAAMVSGNGLQITSTQDIGKIGSFNLGQMSPVSSDQGMQQGNHQQQHQHHQQQQQQHVHQGTGVGSAGMFNYVPSSDFQNATNTMLGGQHDNNSAFPQFGSDSGFGQPSTLEPGGRSGSLRFPMDILKAVDSLEGYGSGIDLSKLESMELPSELMGMGDGLMQNLLQHQQQQHHHQMQHMQQQQQGGGGGGEGQQGRGSYGKAAGWKVCRASSTRCPRSP